MLTALLLISDAIHDGTKGFFKARYGTISKMAILLVLVIRIVKREELLEQLSLQFGFAGCHEIIGVQNKRRAVLKDVTNSLQTCKKKRRKLLPFNPSDDPIRRLEQMASLAIALTATGADFRNELAYLSGMAPRSATRMLEAYWTRQC